MRQFPLVILRICLFVVFFTQTPAIVLSQTTAVTDSLKTEPKALSLVQIPEYGKNTRQLISDIQGVSSNYAQLNEITTGIASLLTTLDSKQAIMSDTAAVYQLDRLEKEERELALLNQRLTQWKTTVQNLYQAGETKDSAAMAMLKIWHLTLDSMDTALKKSPSNNKDKQNPDDLRTEIVSFIGEIDTSRISLHSYLDSVQNIQTVVTLAENKVGNISNIIDSRKGGLDLSIWHAESPPIWKASMDTMQSGKKHRFDDFTNSNSSIIKAFLQNNPKLPYHLVIYIIIIFGIILYLRSKAQSLYTDFPDEFKDAKTVLQFPFLTSLIIIWFGLLIFTSFPKELNDFISMLMLVPLLIILKKINTEWKGYTVVMFSITYLLFLLIREIDYTFLGQRLFLIFVNIISLLVFLYLRKEKRIFEPLNNYWYGVLPFLVKLFIYLCILSILTNVFGSVELAQLLSYVILGTIIVIHALRAAVDLARSFVFLILMGPLVKHSYILKEDGEIVLGKMNQLFKIVGFTALILMLLNLFNAREDTINAIRGIITYRLKVGEFSLSLGNILAFFITIQVTVWLSSTIRYVLEKEVFPRTNMKQGIPNTILLMVKFASVLLGILFAFAAAGIKIDKIAIAMGALGVGIGFGLQNIISNFISGIILALERPITIGDLIDIPNVSGIVRDIGIRASTVRTWDGSDVIVPNADLISNKLTNWTFYDRLRRVKIDIRVPFDANIETVSKILLDTANKIPVVMKKPKAYLNFKGIGTSAMEITLYCWIDDANKIFGRGTAIRKAVYKALLDAGYDTPVPKQDLKITSDGEPLDKTDE